MALPIEQYGLIGDCQTAVLVGADGSIDWMCLPYFDSPACFAALLGTPEHGRWLIAPQEEAMVQRRYRPGTLILETTFETSTGAVTIIDFMTPHSPAPDLIRLVRGDRGQVAMQTELVIRFDYGSVVPWVRRTQTGISAIAGPDTLTLDAPCRLRGEAFTSKAEFTVAAGQSLPFALRWHASHEPSPPAPEVEAALDETERWWQAWSSRCTYEGRWKEAVVRSAITLKALTFAPTGGMVAAATTSLPEQIGGVRNWDYRYCWLRDATFTLYALMNAGYTAEAVAWKDWLVRAVAGDPTQLQIMYSVNGWRRLTELELDWLPGYEQSAPVRIGNAASRQLQLDVWGEVLDALHQCRRHGLDGNTDTWRIERALVKALESRWLEPDEGIWVMRGPRRHFTHSKVLAWVAFDRAIKAVARYGLEGPVERWKAARARVHAEVCQRGFNAQLGSFVQSYDSDLLDASLLMIPLVGFLPPSDPRVRGTVAAIQSGLIRDGFVERYPTQPHVDGLPPGEGAFLACSFWLVDNLALLERFDEAEALFERLLGLRNDLGLLAEEYHPELRRQVGNFPQAFSHVGLINSAHNLSQRASPAEDRRSS
jgi:GH15 family glucan-1,4-alpha-glucosidase